MKLPQGIQEETHKGIRGRIPGGISKDTHGAISAETFNSDPQETLEIVFFLMQKGVHVDNGRQS